MLIKQSEDIKEKIIRKDIEIYNIRNIATDKRKHVKQSKIQLEALKNSIKQVEETLVIPKQFQKDLQISEQTDKILESFNYPSKQTQNTVIKTSPKSQKFESKESNKFLPIGGTYQGIYITKASTKLEDKGKQELSMPFLSTSAHNWISSLRTSTKSPSKFEKKLSNNKLNN